MNPEDEGPTLSPLCQTVTRDGKSVRIDIYEDGKDAWILEVVDQFNNSTVWDDSFPTDQDALAEVLRTMDDDGIESLIGTQELEVTWPGKH